LPARRARRILLPRRGRCTRRACRVACLPGGEASPQQGRRAQLGPAWRARLRWRGRACPGQAAGRVSSVED
jgi:hypothetical protein